MGVFYNEKSSWLKIKPVITDNGDEVVYTVCRNYNDLSLFYDYVSDKIMERSENAMPIRYRPTENATKRSYPMEVFYDFSNSEFIFKELKKRVPVVPKAVVPKVKKK